MHTLVEKTYWCLIQRNKLKLLRYTNSPVDDSTGVIQVTRAAGVDSTGVILVTRALVVDGTGVILVTRAAGVDSILATRESVTKYGKVNQQIILTMHKTCQSPLSQEGSHTLLPVVEL